MKVSCFTFLRNVHILGYPFVESIKSALPLCDEFIVNVGNSEDDTLEMVRGINNPKIRIIQSAWNEKMRTKGYVFGQQKSIAHFNCTGDWAFYLEADEVIHENDIPKIVAAMERYLEDDRVEALVFDFIHFYGNHKTYIWNPHWYRRVPRIIKTSIRSYSPDSLFFVVLESNKKGRYPRAALSNAKIYHYGNVRSELQWDEKIKNISKYWGNISIQSKFDYFQIDQMSLREFKGTHPAVMEGWLPKGVASVFEADPNYVLSKKDIRYRIESMIEKMLGVDLSRKYCKIIRR